MRKSIQIVSWCGILVGAVLIAWLTFSNDRGSHPATERPGATSARASVQPGLPDSEAPRRSPSGATPAADEVSEDPVLEALKGNDLSLARRLLAEQVSPEGTIGSLLALVGAAPDLQTLLMAIQLLTLIDGHEASRALLHIARDPSVALRARSQAIIGLGGRPVEVAAPALLEFLGAEERQLRLAAFRAVGLLGEADLVHAVESAVWHEENPQVRRAGFEALAQLGTADSLASLLSLVEKEGPWAPVDRRSALEVVGTMTSPEAVPGLLDALSRTHDSELRDALIQGLAGSGDRRSFDVLIEALRGSEAGEEARLHAINGLGLIGDSRALPLLEQIESDGGDRERRFSRTAISRIQGTGS